MPFPYDDDFTPQEEFEEGERPTINERRRLERTRMARDPDYRQGRLIAEVVNQRKELDTIKTSLEDLDHSVRLLNRAVFARKSIRPQVQTAGIAAGVSAALVTIAQLLQQLGLLK